MADAGDSEDELLVKRLVCNHRYWIQVETESKQCGHCGDCVPISREELMAAGYFQDDTGVWAPVGVDGRAFSSMLDEFKKKHPEKGEFKHNQTEGKFSARPIEGGVVFQGNDDNSYFVITGVQDGVAAQGSGRGGGCRYGHRRRRVRR